MSGVEVRFCVAGMEVELRLHRGSAAALGGFYGDYASSGTSPDLVLELEQVPGFAEGRKRGPEYPAFERWRTPQGAIGLRRFDAEGVLEVPDEGQPVFGRFRVGDSRNSLEAAIRIGASVTLPRKQGFILHGSGIADAKGAQVFAGVSGAGKSTIAELLAAASPSWTKISDELVILRRTEMGWMACVTPFIGSGGLPHRSETPLIAVNFLAQAPGHRRLPMAPAPSLRELLKHVLVYVAEPKTAALVLELGASLVEDVPCHRLEFARDAGVAEVLHLT